MNTSAALFILAFTMAGTLGGRVFAADRLELKTGEVFYGKILRHSDKEVSIELASGGVLSFRMESVKRVRKESSDWEEEEAVDDKKREPPPLPPVPPPVPVKQPPPVPVSPPPELPDAPPVEKRPEVEDEENVVADSIRGFAVATPRGFVSWPEAQSPSVPLAVRDAIAQSSFTISTYPSEDSVLDIKRNAIRSYTEQFKIFSVHRDEKIEKGPTGAEPEAWLIEIQSRLGEVTVWQLQLFTKREGEVFILTYSATEDMYEKSKESFEKSVGTFRFLERAEPKR
jgi:hypothetical protein